MNERQFTISGELHGFYIDYCDCEYCGGHDVDLRFSIEACFIASSREEAETTAIFLSRSMPTRPWRWEKIKSMQWVSPPFILDEEVQQDQLMIRIGAPMLPGIDAVL